MGRDRRLVRRSEREDFQKGGAAGWLVERGDHRSVVRFLREQAGRIEASYDVVFEDGKKPKLTVPEQRELTDTQMAKVRAVRTAIRELEAGRYARCSESPFNFVVLPDPDASGFLVYFLRAKAKRQEVPVGGHYRATVSADGSKVEQFDRLFASCLTLDRSSAAEKGDLVALSMSQVIAKTPLETTVFLSLQERLPFYVITPDQSLWLVDKGTITRNAAESSPPSETVEGAR